MNCFLDSAKAVSKILGREVTVIKDSISVSV